MDDLQEQKSRIENPFDSGSDQSDDQFEDDFEEQDKGSK